MGKNFGETIDELIELHSEVISICNKIIQNLTSLQTLNLTFSPESAIINTESEESTLKPERKYHAC